MQLQVTVHSQVRVGLLGYNFWLNKVNRNKFLRSNLYPGTLCSILLFTWFVFIIWYLSFQVYFPWTCFHYILTNEPFSLIISPKRFISSAFIKRIICKWKTKQIMPSYFHIKNKKASSTISSNGRYSIFIYKSIHRSPASYFRLYPKIMNTVVIDVDTRYCTLLGEVELYWGYPIHRYVSIVGHCKFKDALQISDKDLVEFGPP